MQTFYGTPRNKQIDRKLSGLLWDSGPWCDVPAAPLLMSTDHITTTALYHHNNHITTTTTLTPLSVSFSMHLCFTLVINPKPWSKLSLIVFFPLLSTAGRILKEECHDLSLVCRSHHHPHHHHYVPSHGFTSTSFKCTCHYYPHCHPCQV